MSIAGQAQLACRPYTLYNTLASSLIIKSISYPIFQGASKKLGNKSKNNRIISRQTARPWRALPDQRSDTRLPSLLKVGVLAGLLIDKKPSAGQIRYYLTAKPYKARARIADPSWPAKVFLFLLMKNKPRSDELPGAHRLCGGHVSHLLFYKAHQAHQMRFR